MNQKTQVSIIIPTLDEAGNIHELCERLAQSLKSTTAKYELIFIDDHSHDNTLLEIKKMQRQFPITVHRKKGQRGKSFSILEGIDLAQYDIIGMIDADLQYPPEILPDMIAKIINHDAAIVIGQRNDNNSSVSRKIGTALTHAMFRLLFGLSIDVQSGIKVFKKQLATSVDPRTVGPWTLDLQLLQNARKQNYLIESVDVAFDKRHHGESKIHFFSDGANIMLDAVKTRLDESTLPLKWIPRSTWLRQMLRFILVGMLNTVIDITLYYALTRFIHPFATHIIIAKGLSYGVAAVNSFWLNKKYTFRTNDTPLFSVVPYVVVSLIGAGINSLVLYTSLNHTNLIEPAALALATLVAFIWNFTVSKLYIFRNTKAPSLELELDTV